MHLSSATVGETISELAALQREVVALARRAEAIDVRSFESDPPEILAMRLAPQVLELLVEGRRLFREIVRACEPAPDGESTDASVEKDPPLAYLPFERLLL